MTDMFIPPAPKVQPRQLPGWRIVLMMSRSFLSFWAEDDFEVMSGRRRTFGVESILMNDPEGIRHVLGTAHAKYTRPVQILRSIRPLTGTGVLLAEGPQWRQQRRLLAPVFTPANVGAVLPHFHEAAEGLLRRLRGCSEVNLGAAFHDATADAVLRALFSTDASRREGRFATMVEDYLTGPGRMSLADAFAKRETDFPRATRERARFGRARRGEVERIVAERRSELPRSGGTDLLGLLLAARDQETGEALSNEDIGDQVATMLFAGFETTSRLLFWAAYLLSQDQNEQSAVRAEVQAFPPERAQNLADLQNWPRLRRTLLETLRLYPPAPVILRQAVEPDEAGGQSILPGANVWMAPWVVHRHRRLWERPTAYFPARWADHPTPWTGVPAFIPFGAGPRICIGASFAMAEAEIMLATLLFRHRLSIQSHRPVMPTAATTIRPDHEPMFRLEVSSGSAFAVAA